MTRLNTKAERNQRANKTVTKLIEAGRDEFDITIVQDVQKLTNRIMQKRGIGIKAARLIVVDFVGVA